MMLKVSLTSRTIAPKLIQPRIGRPDGPGRWSRLSCLLVRFRPRWAGGAAAVVGALAIAGGEATTVRRAGGQAAARARSPRPVGMSCLGQSCPRAVTEM